MALVRPELVDLYQRAKTLEYVTEQIKPFQEKLVKDRKPDPTPEEGKTELTDAQKRQIRDQDNSDGVKKIEEISRLMGEAPKLKFNVNVFRHGVNFDMTEDEIRQDEA